MPPVLEAAGLGVLGVEGALVMVVTTVFESPAAAARNDRQSGGETDDRA